MNRFHSERGYGLCCPTLRQGRERLVDDRFDWLPHTPRFGLQARGNVIVQGQRDTQHLSLDAYVKDPNGPAQFLMVKQSPKDHLQI